MKFILFDDGADLSGPSIYNGMTMTGALKLTKHPTEDDEAVNKEYVDGIKNSLNAERVVSGVMRLALFPDMIGDLTSVSGSGIIDLRHSGVQPGLFPKVTVNRGGVVTSGGSLNAGDIPGFSWNKISVDSRPNTAPGYGITDAVDRINGTVTGNVRVTYTPEQPEDLVNVSYVEEGISTIEAHSVGDIVAFDSAVTPEGFFRCNGGGVYKDMYPELYAVVGERFKGADFSIGAGKPWKQQYYINTQQGGGIGTWATETNRLPQTLQASQAVVTKNRVYLLGGFNNGGISNQTYSAPINSDGTIGTWVTETNRLPQALRHSQAVVTKNRVYLLGGSGSNGYTNQTYSAPINSDGTIGTWVMETNILPQALANSQAVVTKNRVYLLGGYTGTITNQTYSAPINSDGTIGTWVTETNSLPWALYYSQAVVTKNRVYLLAGISLIGQANQTYSAPINSDGTIGTWVTETNRLPQTLRDSQAVVTKNRVYLLGGVGDGGFVINQVFSAPIDSDGTIGTWRTETNTLPQDLYSSQAVVTKNRVYLLGGNISSAINQVFSAPFSGGRNDYSLYYNGGVPLEENVSKSLTGSGTEQIPHNAVNIKVVGRGSDGTPYRAATPTRYSATWSISTTQGGCTTTSANPGLNPGRPANVSYSTTRPTSVGLWSTLGDPCTTAMNTAGRRHLFHEWKPNITTHAGTSARAATNGTNTTISYDHDGGVESETFLRGVGGAAPAARTVTMPDGPATLTYSVPSGGSLTLSYSIYESIDDAVVPTFNIPDYINEEGMDTINYIKH